MMSKQAIRPCPICGNRDVEVLHHQRFVLAEGHILPSELDEVWCAVCGFAFADTAATQNDYDEYYAAYSKYEDAQTSTGGGGSIWDARRLAETAQEIAALATDREARVLDIGCANGGLLGELKKLGFHHLLGVDPSPACVANCQSAYDIEALAGSIRQLPATIGHFDVVILSHVLEHVADLHSTAHDLRALLKPGGLAYIEVPDAARYDEFIVAPFQDFNTEHINHFSLSALRNLFHQHGFAAESCGTKNLPTSGTPYPAAFCFFRAAEGSGEPADSGFEIDEEFHQSLLRYVALSREMIGAIEERLTRSRAAGDALIVWGTGQLTMKLLAETSLADAKITAFVDGNPINHGKKINGISVIAPEAIDDRSTPILIATLLHHREIRDTIREKLRLPNPIIALDG